jgi:aspartate kinase
VAATIVKTLAEGSIQVLQVADSESSFSCLIAEDQAERAVRLLHDAFGLGETTAQAD